MFNKDLVGKNFLNFAFEKDDPVQETSITKYIMAGDKKPKKNYKSSIDKEQVVEICERNPLGFYDPIDDIYKLLKSDENDYLTVDDIESILVKLGGKEFEEGERTLFKSMLDLDADGIISKDDLV